MPAYPAVPGVLRVTFAGTQSVDARLTSRIFIAYSGTAPTNAECVTFGTQCGTQWNANLAAEVDNGFTLTEVDVVDLSSSSAGVGTATVSHAGTRGATELGINTCMCINYEIARRYRGGKPRGFWRMGVFADLNGPAEWTGSFITGVNSAFGSFITDIVGSGWSGAGTLEHVNVSYFQGFTPHEGTTGRYKNIPNHRSGGPITDSIASYSAQVRIGTQRRRVRA